MDLLEETASVLGVSLEKLFERACRGKTTAAVWKLDHKKVMERTLNAGAIPNFMYNYCIKVLETCRQPQLELN